MKSENFKEFYAKPFRVASVLQKKKIAIVQSYESFEPVNLLDLYIHA